MIRILVVEDEPVVRALLCEFLRKNGFDVLEAKDGERGVELYRLAHPQLILTDIMLPGLNGLDLLNEVKSDGDQTIVILMTGYGNEEFLLKALRGGATNYFAKPFDYAELLAFIRSVFRHRTEPDYQFLYTDSLMRENKEFTFGTGNADIHTIVNQLVLNLRLIADEPELTNLRVGLQEMVDNAVEHGNLGFTYEEKSAGIANGTFGEQVQNRLHDKKYAGRHIHVSQNLSSSGFLATIEDEGEGFDWRALPDPTADSLLSYNGRGIFLTKIYYDEVIYNERGNSVTLRKRPSK